MKQLLTERVHISWFIAWLSVGILCGIGLCQRIYIDKATGCIYLLTGISLFFIGTVRRFRYGLVLMILAGTLIGFYRGGSEQRALQMYKPYYQIQVTIHGVVTQDISIGSKGDQRVRLGQVVMDNKSFSGEVWASLAVKADIRRGDHVIITGVLNEGFGTLAATIYRAKLVEIDKPQPGDIALQARDGFSEAIRKSIPDPQASLGIGYLVGQKTSLPESLEKQIQIAGLTHVIVASGYNLTILVALARRTLSKISKYLATITGSFMIVGFIMITGLSPSMSRAGLVAGLSLLAWYYGRVIHPFVLLSFAAAITVLLRPSYIWGDVGWYLSFTAFSGVIVLAPLINHYFWEQNTRISLFRDLIIATLSAQALTLPIILYTFGQFSVYALIANILVLPFVPLAMLATFIGGLSGLFIPPLAMIMGLPATLILRYTTYVIDRVSHLPNAQASIMVSLKCVMVSYCLMAAIIGYFWWKTKHNFRISENFNQNLI